jgi:hypothetical protein
MSKPKFADTSFRMSVISSVLQYELNRLRYQFNTTHSDEVRHLIESVCDCLSHIKAEVDVLRSR